jgi:predicted DNA-binding ribbon-helix-helix protein
MCEIFLRGDPALFEKRSRSMRIDGHVTSVCVEVIFWDMLERVSREQNLKLSQFISELYREGLIKTGEINNLSSVLRVACLNYLTHEDTVLRNTQRTLQATMTI